MQRTATPCTPVRFRLQPPIISRVTAQVVKLVDTRDLKSLDHCDRAGSIPALGTTYINKIARYSLQIVPVLVLK